ncbi:MAG: helix-turn-helix domain-containing protein [Prevotellaceae bacterium]|nr:helix-turn-helix domain-containing protein [Prevotellaceae bacterium]
MSNRKGFSIAEVAVLLGCCKQTIYNLAHSEKIKAIRISRRMTIIPQKSIDEFLEVNTPYEILPAQERKPVSDWYTLLEITEKYGIKYRRLRDIINSENIPEKKDGKITLIAKNRIDTYFRKQGYDETIQNLSEWVTLPEFREQYSMTEPAAYSFLSENRIPKKQRNGRRYYSKLHIDKVKNKGQ